MRELKFRAWFPQIYFSQPHMAYLDKNDDFGGRSATWDLLSIMDSGKPNTPIYMQYTGLKDKNGVEIYEGDIVAWERNPKYTAGRPKKSQTLYVRYNKGRYELWKHYPSQESAYCFLYYKDCRVIGNKYESPELLNKDK